MGPSPHPLAALFDPQSVAVIGASEDPGKYGNILLRTLIEQGYGGAIHAVNPRGGALLGQPFLRSLDEAKGPVDIALIVRPAEECPAVVREMAGRGVRFAIVYAAGFAEKGREGQDLQRALVEAARTGPTRLVGPNGMNVFSAPARVNLSGIVPFPEGELAFLSASGNLGYAFAQEAAATKRVGFSRFVSVGNQADLALDEYLDYLQVDEVTRAVLVYLEGLVPGRSRHFLDAVARTAQRKPVLILRGGRTRTGQGTARSHTAALSPAPEVMRAALEQAGAVLLDRADEALAVAESFLCSPLPRGRKVVLVGEGGGHATLATDAAVESGLVLPALPESLVETIRPHLPPFAAIVNNPVEMGGISEVNPRVYEKVLPPVFAWPECESLVLFGGYALYQETTARLLAERREAAGVPVILHDLYAGEPRPAFETLHAHRLPVYASADVAVRCASALARGSRARRRAERWVHGAPTVVSEPDLPPVLATALQEARFSPSRALPEDAAARLLAHFGVNVLEASLARDAEQAVLAAGHLGYPVVLKLHAASVVHKTEAGGVRLDLRTPDEVREAFREVTRNRVVQERCVRLTPYRPGGIEVLAGARRDPELGALLVVGVGGVAAETVGDVAIRTLPCSPEDYGEMPNETSLGRLLTGTRGAPPADQMALLAAIDSLAGLILALPEVTDVEVNPLRCGPDGCVALDARVLVAA